MTTRKIIHIDMDAFYASVEQRDNPALKGKPVAVGGSAKRGVVAAASYEARKYGVRSAMPSITAARKCPELIFVKPRFEQYKMVSNQIREIFETYTDLIEPLSLDEAYLDVTNDKKGIGSATLVAEAIRKEIFETTQLTASAGVSINKFLAKVASDINKPNGIKVIYPHEAQAFIEALKIEKFFGIGKVTAKKMHGLGIFTGADLKSRSELELIRYFGKSGRYYHKLVRGEDDRPVNPNRIRKSIGAERTFSEDINDLQLMMEKLEYVAEKVFKYCTLKDNFGRTLTVKIKTADFKLITRSKSFQSEIRDFNLMLETIRTLLFNNQEDFDQVRLLGVSVSNLSKEQRLDFGEQLKLNFEFE